MIGDLNFLPVNWIDGMKISRLHFDQNGQYLEEQLRDISARRLKIYDFGLLPAKNSFEINVTLSANQQINIELNACKAVTPNGCRIQLLPGNPLTLNTTFKEVMQKFNLQASELQMLYIVLTVNIFERIPIGEPLENENPPRHPFTQPHISLNLMPAEQINTGHLGSGLVLGKITNQNGELIYHKDYIPPCTSIASLPALDQWYRHFKQQFDNWEQYCIKIIQKINSKAQQQQPTVLSTAILELSKNMLKYLSAQKLYNQWVISQEAPVHLFVFLLNPIQYLYTLLVCYTEREREELLNYFAEWAEMQAGSIEKSFIQSLQLQYNHYDLQQVFTEADQVSKLYILIFQKLSMLEFIGKKKGQNIFVIEQELNEAKPQNPPQEKSNTRWSPLS